MSKASEESLSDLHSAVARGLTEVIDKGALISVDADGKELRATAPAAYFMAAITMLKNNSITADPSDNEDLAEFTASLARKRAKSKDRLSKEAIDAAASALERDLGGFGQMQ